MNLHFIAIGGSVMHQLAITLKKKGYNITGSDDEIFEPAKTNLQIENLLPPREGWFPDKIHEGLDAVILGMHAKENNPELIKAKELGLKIYSFPEYIFQESILKKRVVVGGSHGKTTTTAMIMHILKYAGIDFDYLVGAKLAGFPQSVRISDAKIIICEGDEYPASAVEKRPKFHFLIPHIAIITGIAWDHINVFPTFENYVEQFRIFIDKIESGGCLIYNQTDVVLSKMVDAQYKSIRKIPYDIPIHITKEGKTIVQLEGEQSELMIFGDHNLLNLHAAWHACMELGVSNTTFLQAIKSFTGASKRLELLAANEMTNVYRDFAHAPSKVKATIEAVKKQFPHRKLIAVLELHTYSSLNGEFMGEYRHVMELADQALVYYSAHALELKQMPPLLKEKIIKGFDKIDLMVINKKDDLIKWFASQSYENANLLLMSSGDYDGMDITTFANKILG
jgi:UDP-N-acetylmuramate: L-alanyl-gamma-D-glutamyl-meso-diaminopimelate ligase